jgi:uncharacterized iron-regulated protein
MRSAPIRFLAAALALASPVSVGAEGTPEGCVPVGAWIDPASGERRDDAPATLARRAVVLLGEAHESAEHHRWQLHTVAALLGHRTDLVLGFEMFPRRVQGVLDRWSNGELDEAAFLRAVDWPEIWGMDAALYLPLFHFARMHRVPMLALNVDRATTRRVAAQGLAAIPVAEREGVGDPAPPSSAYRDRLFAVFKNHPLGGEGAREDSEPFRRFVEAQAFADRAMAEAIAGAPGRLVVGIIGQGHVEYRSGVAHQLAALRVAQVATALPWPADGACRRPDADIADAVFGVAPPRPAPPARLGVVVSATAAGVRIDRVMPQSIADATGLQVGDVIESAAGIGLRRPADLVAVVRRQAPGTWLPLQVRRGEHSSEMVARFPAGP